MLLPDNLWYPRPKIRSWTQQLTSASAHPSLTSTSAIARCTSAVLSCQSCVLHKPKMAVYVAGNSSAGNSVCSISQHKLEQNCSRAQCLMLLAACIGDTKVIVGFLLLISGVRQCQKSAYETSMVSQDQAQCVSIDIIPLPF